MSILSALPHISSLFPHPQGALSPTNPGYVYIGVILEAFGQERQVAELWDYLAVQFGAFEDQSLLARRLREGLLKASVLVGFPRVGPSPPP